MNNVAAIHINSQKNDKVQQWRFFVRSLTGCLGAFLCFITVHYLYFVFLLPYLIVYFLPLYFKLPEKYNYYFGIILYLILCPTHFLFSLAIGRFLLRLYPPSLSGKRRRELFGILLVYILSIIFLLFYEYYNSEIFALFTKFIFLKLHKFIGDQIGRLFGLVFQTLLYIIFLIPIVGIATPTIQRQWTLRKSLKKPFVLFLRRFSSYADKTILNFILKGTPAGRPVAFLTATHSKAGDWNPYLIGFSGLKLLKPIRSLPIIIRSTDLDWKAAAVELIQKSEKIVMDLSDGSSAIKTEIEMIERAEKWPDTVILISEKKATDKEFALCKKYSAEGAKIIKYKKSWWKAMPKLILGIFIATLLSLPIIFIPITPFILVDAMMSEPQIKALKTFITFNGALSAGYLIICYALGWGWLYYVFFVRPAFNRAAKKALREALS